VDAGPVLLPRAGADPGSLRVDRLEPGYVVYDAFDWFEATGLSGEGRARPQRFEGRSELFVVG
jgi:hypothetical protein